MKKILVVCVNQFPLKDWESVENKDDVSVDAIRLDEFVKKIETSQYDLVCFFCEGSLVQQLFESNKDKPVFQQFWKSQSVKKVVWSMDSHHQWPIETQYQHYFSTYYLAHSGYINKFAPGKAVWLPCSLFVDTERTELLQLVAQKNKKTYDVVSVYRNYLHIGDRNAAIYECCQYIKEKNLSAFLGQTDQVNCGQNRYYQALLSGKIILNLSITDDLNMRNFEALALNQIMVTNRVADHEKIDLDYSNTVFFDRFDEHSFAEALEIAIGKTEKPIKRTIDSVINKHMQIHRYVEIFNRELNLNLNVPDIDVDQTLLKIKNEENIVPEFLVSEEAGDLQYDEIEIAVKACYSYIQKNSIEKALPIIMWLLDEKPEFPRTETNIYDLFMLGDLCKAKGIETENYKIDLFVLCIMHALTKSLYKGFPMKYIPLMVELLSDKQLQMGRVAKVLKIKLNAILCQLLEQLVKTKKIVEADRCLSYITTLGEKNEKKFYLLGAEVNRLLGRADEAIAYYEKAVRD